jgi:hypothetical protein
MEPDRALLVNLSGRGDKDLDTVLSAKEVETPAREGGSLEGIQSRGLFYV